MSAQPTLTVTIPLEVYEAAVAALERASTLLWNGAVADQVPHSTACWDACYDLRKAIGAVPSADHINAASEWARSTMAPADREHYFGG
jgi:hypothetical protein